MALLICLAGFFGGLVLSAVKRDLGAKDWGSSIAGHGGFMDRLDSVTFGVILLVLIGLIHGGLGNVPTGFLYW